MVKKNGHRIPAAGLRGATLDKPVMTQLTLSKRDAGLIHVRPPAPVVITHSSGRQKKTKQSTLPLLYQQTVPRPQGSTVPPTSTRQSGRRGDPVKKEKEKSWRSNEESSIDRMDSSPFDRATNAIASTSTHIFTSALIDRSETGIGKEMINPTAPKRGPTITLDDSLDPTNDEREMDGEEERRKRSRIVSPFRRGALSMAPASEHDWYSDARKTIGRRSSQEAAAGGSSCGKPFAGRSGSSRLKMQADVVAQRVVDDATTLEEEVDESATFFDVPPRHAAFILAYDSEAEDELDDSVVFADLVEGERNDGGREGAADDSGFVDECDAAEVQHEKTSRRPPTPSIPDRLNRRARIRQRSDDSHVGLIFEDSQMLATSMLLGSLGRSADGPPFLGPTCSSTPLRHRHMAMSVPTDPAVFDNHTDSVPSTKSNLPPHSSPLVPSPTSSDVAVRDALSRSSSLTLMRPQPRRRSFSSRILAYDTQADPVRPTPPPPSLDDRDDYSIIAGETQYSPLSPAARSSQAVVLSRRFLSPSLTSPSSLPPLTGFAAIPHAWEGQHIATPVSRQSKITAFFKDDGTEILRKGDEDDGEDGLVLQDSQANPDLTQYQADAFRAAFRVTSEKRRMPPEQQRIEEEEEEEEEVEDIEEIDPLFVHPVSMRVPIPEDEEVIVPTSDSEEERSMILIEQDPFCIARSTSRRGTTRLHLSPPSRSLIITSNSPAAYVPVSSPLSPLPDSLPGSTSQTPRSPAPSRSPSGSHIPPSLSFPPASSTRSTQQDMSESLLAYLANVEENGFDMETQF